MAKLEHCNIRSIDLPATIAFYENVVGLQMGPFPGTPGKGAWLYDDSGTAVVHIIGVDPHDSEATAEKIARRLGELAGPLDVAMWRGGGAIDHIAFQCSGYAAMAAKLDALALPFRTNIVESMKLSQIFVNDPSGVTLELNFRD